MNLASAPRHEESAGQPYAAVSVGPSEAGQIMRDKVLALVPLIRREAEAGEKLGAMTPAVVNALNEVGFFKITLPREYGGYGFGARDIAEVVGAAATGDGSTAWSGFVSVGLRNAFVFDEQTVSELMADLKLLGGASHGWRIGLLADCRRCKTGRWRFYGPRQVELRQRMQTREMGICRNPMGRGRRSPSRDRTAFPGPVRNCRRLARHGSSGYVEQ